ncbi:hypothetical protein D3C72_2065990 [compost metagenome]
MPSSGRRDGWATGSGGAAASTGWGATSAGAAVLAVVSVSVGVEGAQAHPAKTTTMLAASRLSEKERGVIVIRGIQSGQKESAGASGLPVLG